MILPAARRNVGRAQQRARPKLSKICFLDHDLIFVSTEPAAGQEAYGGRCALSGFPEHRLLNAAHIIDDGHETLGQPIVSNGLPLTRIHHAAFDAHLIGIDADLRLHVSPRLLGQKDGPALAALNDLHGMTPRRPLRPQDAPDRDQLAHRFEEFWNNVGA